MLFLNLTEGTGPGPRGEDCTVCLDPITAGQERSTHATACQNSFHTQCLKDLVRIDRQSNALGCSRCPACRGDITDWFRPVWIEQQIVAERRQRELRATLQLHTYEIAKSRIEKEIGIAQRKLRTAANSLEVGQTRLARAEQNLHDANERVSVLRRRWPEMYWVIFVATEKVKEREAVLSSARRNLETRRLEHEVAVATLQSAEQALGLLGLGPGPATADREL